jgi:hypothetical protein
MPETGKEILNRIALWLDEPLLDLSEESRQFGRDVQWMYDQLAPRTDSTPTAVTVSDRMRGLVDEFEMASHNERRYDVNAARDNLLREIGKLEANACEECLGPTFHPDPTEERREAPIERMPKIVKDAPAVGEPLQCEHGLWQRPHVIRCQRCFPYEQCSALPETPLWIREQAAEERLECQTCGGDGQIEVGTERPHDGGEVSVYDDCPDCADKPACLPQTLGEEKIPAPQGIVSQHLTNIPALVNGMAAHLRTMAKELERIDWPGGASGCAALEDAADEIDRLLTALEDAEAQVEEMRGAYQTAVNQRDFYKGGRNTLALANTELQSSLVLQKEELDIMRQHRDDARLKLQHFRDQIASDCL